MFNFIGGKIKALAKVVCWLGIIGSVITGIGMMASSRESEIILGILVIILGSLISWIGSFFTYGFGELIETADRISVRAANIESTLDRINSKLNSGEYMNQNNN